MPKLTRRQSFAALAGGGVAVGMAGVGVFASDEGELARSILHRVIGPFRMPDADFQTFVANLESGHQWKDTARFALFRFASETGPNTGPVKLREKLDDYERKVVTNFLTRTDYLAIDPKTERVTFVGDSAGCSSPFAKFDMA